MKKLNVLITIVLLVVGIAACETSIVEIPIETIEPVVPVERDPQSNGVDTTPEVIVEFVDRFIDVPANLERQRQYLPGTYMLAESRPNNQNGYVFSVVVIDDYGRIAGVYIDQTLSTRNLFQSPEGDFYAFLAGNRVNIPDSYRQIQLSTPLINYPTTNDAIRSADLVVGVDREEITALTRVVVNETRQLTSNRVATLGQLTYQQQMQAVAKKIIEDNTTYGFNLIELDDVLTTNSIEGITEPLDVALFLVQSILDGPAKLPEATTLRKIDDPKYGVYQTGTYATFSPMAYVDSGLVHGLSVVVVDDFGRMTGVYLDEIVSSTARANIVASKQILKAAVGLSVSQPLEWYEQANLVSQQIVTNQGINGLTLSSSTASVSKLIVGLPQLQITNMTNIAIRANEILLATQENLTSALYRNYVDGTYLVSSPSSFAYITIYNQELIDVYVDRLVFKDQAQVFRSGQTRDVERVVRQFSTPTGLANGDVLVYASGASYYSVFNVVQLDTLILSTDQHIEKDELMVLTEGERNSLRPVTGWHTASSLVQVDAVQSTWYNDSQQLATEIETRGSISDFQLVNGRVSNLPGIAQVQANSLLELVANGLFQARQITMSGLSVPFVPQVTPLADGSYFAYDGPKPNGAFHTTYMVVKEGKIISLVVDATFLVNNQLTSLLFTTNPVKDDLIALSNSLRQSQSNILYSLIEKAAPIPTIRSIQSIILTDIEDEVFSAVPFEAVLDDVISQATNAKQTQDIQWIRNYFANDVAYFSGTTLIGSQNKNNWLPSSLSNAELSHAYRLQWRTEERDLSIFREGDSFSVRVSRLDANKTAVLDLEIYTSEFGPPMATLQFTLPLRQPSTHGLNILNSKAFDFTSLTWLEGSQITLPTSNELTISWISRRPEILTAAGVTSSVTQATTVDLIAYVDLDGDGVIDPNEPVRIYTITVIPLAQAMIRLRNELDTNQLGDFIGNTVSLRQKSSILGLSYTWTIDNPNVVVIEVEEETQLYVRALDVQQTVQLTASVNVPNNNITLTYKVDTGNRVLYRKFATMDLPVTNTKSPLYPGQSIFENYSSQGRFYKSQISFYTTDFGRFVDASGVVIFQHPTIDACFDAVVTAKYSGGVVESSVSTTESFCVMSTKTLQQQINEDRNQLQDYVIDLGISSHVDTPVVLPLKSWLHQLPVRWEVVEEQESILEFFDLTNISSGIVVVKTTNEDIADGISLRLNAVVDVVAGTPPVQRNKQILIQVQD